MKKTLFYLALFIPVFLSAQQSTPIKMLFQPRDNFITFSGAGGGNLYNFFKAAGSASGILGLDGNIKLAEDVIKKKKTELQSLALMMKVNMFNNTALDTLKSLDIRRLVFQDNDFRISLGARYNFLVQKKENPDDKLKTFATAFFDMIIVPYRMENSTAGNKGLTTVSLNMGGKFGFLTKWVGLFGITVNPQIDMLFIAEKAGGTTLEEVFKTAPTIDFAKSYFGLGAKIEIPLNDFCLFMDFRKYFKMGSGTAIDGLADKMVFSLGGMAIGSIFKNKDKTSKTKPKGNGKTRGN